MYDVIELANYAAFHCQAIGRPVRNVSLQAILYQIQMEALKRNTLAFSNEFAAWRNGPVLPEVYHRFRSFGAGAIPAGALRREDVHEPSAEDRDWIDGAIEAVGGMHPWETRGLFCKAGGAWSAAFREGGKERISIDAMRRELGLAESAAALRSAPEIPELRPAPASSVSEPRGDVSNDDAWDIGHILMNALSKLNDVGKAEAVKRVVEMTQLPNYIAR